MKNWNEFVKKSNALLVTASLDKGRYWILVGTHKKSRETIVWVNNIINVYAFRHNDTLLGMTLWQKVGNPSTLHLLKGGKERFLSNQTIKRSVWFVIIHYVHYYIIQSFSFENPNILNSSRQIQFFNFEMREKETDGGFVSWRCTAHTLCNRFSWNSCSSDEWDGTV